MKPCQIILCHSGIEATLDRHRKFWEASGQNLVCYVSPTDLPVFSESVGGARSIQVGQGAHCGPVSIAKLKSVFNMLRLMEVQLVTIFEYDSLMLEPQDFDENADYFLGHKFDNYDNRFVAPDYYHAPWTLSLPVLRRITEQFNRMNNSDQMGYFDRYISKALMTGGIPARGYSNSFSSNTIEPHQFGDMQTAIRERNVRILHGVKSEACLTAALAALPKS